MLAQLVKLLAEITASNSQLATPVDVHMEKWSCPTLELLQLPTHSVHMPQLLISGVKQRPNTDFIINFSKQNQMTILIL